jgi:gluconokinase
MKQIVVMGVAGCGKSSVGEAVAQALGWALIEGDDHHPEANQVKMRAGTPLTDEDRAGWLDTLGRLLAQPAAHGGVVLTCSALKRRYRDQLRSHAPAVHFVWLRIDETTALARVTQRASQHLFPPSLVKSQFAALEAPTGEAGVLEVDATQEIRAITERVLAWVEQESRQ